MVVGYSLGNKNPENDILVIGENDPDVVTFSSSLEVALTRQCHNACGYCPFKGNEELSIPYSTINNAKQARLRGIREVHYMSGERPDKSSYIRSILNLWGFPTYADYIYTVAELGFLEGLIPVLEAGICSINELSKFQDIVALYKIMLDGIDEKNHHTVHEKSIGKKLDYRLKMLEWTGKLNFPVITGFITGIGETKAFRKEMLKLISQAHQEYGHVHEVLIQNFVPSPNTVLAQKSAPSTHLMLDTIELAQSILPEDITLTVPIHLNQGIIPEILKAGIRDFGRIPDTTSIVFPHIPKLQFETLEQAVNDAGLRLQQRFPIKYDFIKNGNYCKKLGQVFDAYKYKIKKADQLKAANV